MRIQRNYRKGTGSLMADYPLAIWMLLFFFTFPLLNLSTVALRATFLISAAKEAVHAAAKANTFQDNLSASELSAVNIADARAREMAGRFSEIAINRITTRIVTITLANGNISRSTTKLAAPADVNTYTYDIEVTVEGTVNPLITYRGNLLGNVPGLTGSTPFTVTAREFCESPQGLNQ